MDCEDDTQKCSISGCEFDCNNHTDTLWGIKPNNVQEKPICEFHYYQRKFFESSLFPLSQFIIPFALILLFMPSSIILYGVLFIIGFIISAIISIIAFTSMEYMIRYVFMNKPPLQKRYNSKVEYNANSDNHECVMCGESCNDGIWKENSYRLELFGEPIDEYKNIQNYYCSECAKSKNDSDKENSTECSVELETK